LSGYKRRKNKKILFERCTDVKYLRTKIKPLFRKVCDKKNIKWINKDKCVNKKGLIFPYRYFLDLKFICKLYGCNFEVRKYGNHGYSEKKKLIYLATEEDGFVTTYSISKNFTHELAHRIQHIEWENNKYFTINFFEKALLYERSADRLAYFIYKEYFSHLWNFSHQVFNSYKSKSDIKFLREYLRGNLKGMRWRA